MVSVIIPCGGKSTRMGGIDKLFLEIEGISVIERTVMPFADVNSIKEIILCCSDSFKSKFYSVLKSNFKVPVKFAPNGETRQQSVANGFKIVDNTCNFVCVHDGARPLISSDTISKAILDAKKYGSSVVCVPCKDTVKISDNFGYVKETPPRDTLFLTQTPQIFSYKKYKEALEFSWKNSLDFTDDSQLFEALGIMPHITVGDYSNIKITTPEDIAVAQQILKFNKSKG
ncbi:MAG: 2-C-methyl-D-erythritol 4-phosphate cytidylyltransferase [Clostridiales bacterium]|nr:2-C-methyl-D-erythritol 4-phosphate cytidylyltransferase [Clostridiales bacterium]